MDAHVNGQTADGAVLANRLDEVERQVPILQIADVWLFPPLPDVVDSSEFLLFTQVLEGDVRALYSARMVPANGRPAHQVIVEHGSAPADRVPGLVSGLQRRLGQSLPARHVHIDGEPERWRRFVDEARGSTNGVARPD